MAAFLDNTGDIILDAVLTDYGRQLLAKGDGSFNIVKFAFGDDEIDYSLFNTGAVSPNQDTLIMSTPILEAVTNNIASLQNKLVTIKQENLLFLPVLKLNTIESINKSGSFNSLYTGFVVPVDPSSDSTSTANASNNLKTANTQTLLDGVLGPGRLIRVDQGLDSTKLNNKESLEVMMPELYETEFNVMIDSRFGKIEGAGEPIAIDDDYTATYRMTINSPMVKPIQLADPNRSSIAGTKGTFITFRIVPTTEINTSNVYFNQYGTSAVQLKSGTNFRTIRSAVEVMGVKTGFSIQIPILFAKI